MSLTIAYTHADTVLHTGQFIESFSILYSSSELRLCYGKIKRRKAWYYVILNTHSWLPNPKKMYPVWLHVQETNHHIAVKWSWSSDNLVLLLFSSPLTWYKNKLHLMYVCVCLPSCGIPLSYSLTIPSFSTIIQHVLNSQIVCEPHLFPGYCKPPLLLM